MCVFVVKSNQRIVVQNDLLRGHHRSCETSVCSSRHRLQSLDVPESSSAKRRDALTKVVLHSEEALRICLEHCAQEQSLWVVLGPVCIGTKPTCHLGQVWGAADAREFDARGGAGTLVWCKLWTWTTYTRAVKVPDIPTHNPTPTDSPIHPPTHPSSHPSIHPPTHPPTHPSTAHTTVITSRNDSSELLIRSWICSSRERDNASQQAGVAPSV